MQSSASSSALQPSALIVEEKDHLTGASPFQATTMKQGRLSGAEIKESLTPLRAIPWPTHEPSMRTHHPFVVMAKAKGAHLPTIHVDGWFARLAIAELSSILHRAMGKERLKEGYEGLVEAAAIIARRNTVEEQQEMVEEALKKAFPQALLSLASLLYHILGDLFDSKIARMLARVFYKHESVKNPFGFNQRVRLDSTCMKLDEMFLEATNCAGMCTNLCKLPSQKFIRESLGMPTYMVPNFEEKSCEIIFGQHPPADDPALKQPCYQRSCMAKQAHGVDCSR
ncbi:hypothetical protein HPP92_009406 [Vanilla planifolia]|uniref:Beta-carotene isomerase D27-like C-terminal domain-containing protein n=1 Tax=Vanilla planifolia TaxID=51239 RepID=A0A835R7S4_VANPL|nr:hypothetical protein HPP92_009406 [Vanilla planifolia]